ncbi:pH nine-sensitive protein 1, partial [Elasticomyces elasticus]
MVSINQHKDSHRATVSRISRWITDDGKQNYSQNPPTFGDNFVSPMDDKQTFQQTFKINKPKFNDLWAGILFILVFLGFAAVLGITLYRYSKYHSFNGGGIYNAGNDFSLNTNTLVLFAFVLVMAFVLSWGYFLACRAFTKQFVWLTGILNCAFAVGTAVYYLYKHLWGAGIVFAIFAVFAIICFISWIPRIPFAVVMLQQAQDVARMKRVHVFWVAFIGGVAALAFSAWFSATLVGIYTAYEPSNANANANPACAAGGCSSGRVIGLIVFVTSAGYWISEWIKNT